MVFGVLAFFPDIDQDKLVAAVKSSFDVVNAHFSDSLFGILDDVQKTGRMLVGHGTPSKQVCESILAKIDGGRAFRPLGMAGERRAGTPVLQHDRNTRPRP